MEDKIMYGVFKEEEHSFGYEGDIVTSDVLCVYDIKEDAIAYANKCNGESLYTDDYLCLVKEVFYGIPLTTPAKQEKIAELIKQANELGMVMRLKTQKELDQEKSEENNQ